MPQAHTEPATFLTGSLLYDLAESHTNHLRKELSPDTRLGPSLTLRWGTICSGGEVMLFVLLAIAKALAEHGVRLNFVHVFSCEIAPKLQEWIMALFAEVGARVSIQEGCLFERAEHMGQKTAKCVRHGRHCPVPDADLVCAGTSCKDWSKSKGLTAAQKGKVLDAASSTGGSAQTFHGLIAYLACHLVTLLMFENVDTLDESDDAEGKSIGEQPLMSALARVCQAFLDCGLVCRAMLTDAQLFGLPTERRRYYIIGANPLSRLFTACSADDIKQALARAAELMTLLERTPPDVQAILYDQSDNSVDAELARRMTTGAKQGSYNVSSSIAHHSGRGTRWGDFSVVPADSKTSPWFKTLCPSNKNNLVGSFTERQTGCIMRDISQSLTRLRFSKIVDATDGPPRHVAFCQMPGQSVWLSGHGVMQVPRLMLGKEALLIQGYPVALVPELVAATSDRIMMGIAGNMFAATVPLAMLLPVFAMLPWAAEDDAVDGTLATTAEECHAALQMLGLEEPDTPAATADDGSATKKMRVVYH